VWASGSGGVVGLGLGRGLRVAEPGGGEDRADGRDPGAAEQGGGEPVGQGRRVTDPVGARPGRNAVIAARPSWGLRQFGRNEDGARELEEAIDVAASAGLFNTVQWALADLALVHLNLDRPDVARDLFDRADAASRNVGDGAGTVLADYGHGLLALQDSDVDEAERRVRSARDGFAALRTPVWEGWALVTEGRCAELRDDNRTADDAYATAQRLGLQAGEPGLTASALEGLARTRAATDPNRSRHMEREAGDLRARLGRPRPHYLDAVTS
jgi:hypothetical protein